MTDAQSSRRVGHADPRLLVVGASVLAINGIVVLAETTTTISTVIGGMAFVSAGVFATMAWRIKEGQDAQ